MKLAWSNKARNGQIKLVRVCLFSTASTSRSVLSSRSSGAMKNCANLPPPPPPPKARHTQMTAWELRQPAPPPPPTRTPHANDPGGLRGRPPACCASPCCAGPRTHARLRAAGTACASATALWRFTRCLYYGGTARDGLRRTQLTEQPPPRAAAAARMYSRIRLTRPQHALVEAPTESNRAAGNRHPGSRIKNKFKPTRRPAN